MTKEDKMRPEKAATSEAEKTLGRAQTQLGA